jgi:colanic acid/amylovoran biosynthesis protein
MAGPDSKGWPFLRVLVGAPALSTNPDSRLAQMPLKPNNILLLGAAYTTGNLGVWTLASGAIASALHSYPNAQIDFLDYNRSPEEYQVRHPGGLATVRLFNLRFSKKFWLPNNISRLLVTAMLIRAIPSKLIRKKLISRNFWLQKIQEADLVGSIAGGDSFSDIYGIGRLFYVALPQILVLITGKPLALLPQTYGPFKSALAKVTARLIIRKSVCVYSRDQEGLQTIRTLGYRKRREPEFCYDLGFILPPFLEGNKIPGWLNENRGEKPLIGLNVSGLLSIGGYNRRNMFGLIGDYKSLIRDIVEYFVDKKKAEVMLIPHVLDKNKNQENDENACLDVFRNSKKEVQAHLHLVGNAYNHHELKALIGKCDFFLGSRMHACIGALSQGIPAVGLAYSKKFKGVFAALDMEDLVVDIRENDPEMIIRRVDQIYTEQDIYREKLKKKLPEVRATVSNLFERVYLKMSGASID